ncbi:unnamed protein product [Trichogramma brassicae]|uniref:CCHC-type domain-containing protein n=1 Tax=Trichogramma brassicae TaxID=86971 RepID=A0A6H5J350_9HYME|nr:unnamed protein product [Trichogramma brassicae]
MDPSKPNPPSTSGTCPGSTSSSSSSNNTSERHAFSEPEIVPRTIDPVMRRPRQGQRMRQVARGSHTPVPTTQQAVVLDWVPDIQLDSYIATVGNIVAPAHVRYASLVQPNRVCLFVSDAQMAQTLHGRTVVVEGHTLLIQPLIQPLARVLATNVYPFVEDQTIRAHLALHHGVQVRDIVHVGADTQLPEYGHVLGFARHLYVPPEQLPIVPGRITGRQADWPYLIYLGSEEQRCSSCRHVGHLARYCAMDQRCIGAYGGSTTDRRSSMSSGSSAHLTPNDEGPPAYSLTAETDANVASSSAPILPRGVVLPSLKQSPAQRSLNMSAHATSPHFRQVRNTIRPSPLADPSAPQPGTSTDHSLGLFAAAMMGSTASQSNIAADPSPSRPSNAAAAATPSTSAGTPKKSIVRLDTVDTSLVQSPPSSSTRSLTARAAACPPSGDGQPQPAESRPRPATPRSSRFVRRPETAEATAASTPARSPITPFRSTGGRRRYRPDGSIGNRRRRRRRRNSGGSPWSGDPVRTCPTPSNEQQVYEEQSYNVVLCMPVKEEKKLLVASRSATHTFLNARQQLPWLYNNALNVCEIDPQCTGTLVWQQQQQQ